MSNALSLLLCRRPQSYPVSCGFPTEETVGKVWVCPGWTLRRTPACRVDRGSVYPLGWPLCHRAAALLATLGSPRSSVCSPDPEPWRGSSKSMWTQKEKEKLASVCPKSSHARATSLLSLLLVPLFCRCFSVAKSCPAL